MAQRKSFFDDVKKELECSVCQELFSEVNEPKILKCLHTFCKNCLEAWLSRQREGQLSCPTCRQVTECPNSNINSLPSNLFYKQMVEIVEAYSGTAQEDDSQHCGNCEEKTPLKFYCFACNTFLCEECAGAHSKWKLFKGHHVKEIGNFESSDVQDYARKSNVCKKHKDALRFYCENCNICICRDCAILGHRDDRNHNIVSLEQGFENKKSDITSKMKDVEAIASRLRDQKQTLEKKKVRMLGSIDQATSEIHRVAEQWISCIRQNEAAMTKKLLEQKNSFQGTFSAQMSSLDEKLIEIDSSLVFSSDVLARENLPEILNVEEILDKRFQELSSEFHVNLNYSYVKYVPNDTSPSMNDMLGKLVVSKTDPTLTTANGKGLTEGTEDELCSFKIETRNSQGQVTYSGVDKVGVDIRSVDTGKVIVPEITDSKNGCYEVKYRPKIAGKFELFITVDGDAIVDSPFRLEVNEKRRQPEPSGLNNKSESCSFDIQPRVMQLLKRVHKRKLQDVQETFSVEIDWIEKTNQVNICPKKGLNNLIRLQEGCDAFINLYQEFYPNMAREEVELSDSVNERRVQHVVSLAEADDPIIIEKADRNLVVYAEKNSIRGYVQVLKEKLGIASSTGRNNRINLF